MSPDRPEALGVLLLVADALEAAGIAYHLGGSLASSVHGTPRQTQDIDIVVEIDAKRADALLSSLGDGFYADASSARDAIERRDSFNLIHLDSGIKVDLFVRGDTAFDRSEFERGPAVAGRVRDRPGAGRDGLDLEYLGAWARQLGVTDLVERAVENAG